MSVSLRADLDRETAISGQPPGSGAHRSGGSADHDITYGRWCLTRSGWTLVGATPTFLALGVWLHYSEMITLGLATLLSLAVAAVWTLNRPQLDVTREIVPARVSEGDGASGVIRVTNAGKRRSSPILAIESLAGASISVALPALGGGEAHTTTYRLSTERRGCYTVGPLRISRSDPLRLVALSSTPGPRATLFVHPRVHRVSPIPTGRSQDAEGPTSTAAPSGGIVFHSLREYEPGDDVRLIHWRSTARTGTLMVRHTVVTNEPRLLVVLDISADSYDDASFEDAVRVAASLVAAGVEKRFPTEFRTTGGHVVSVDPSGRGRTEVMDTLALIERTADDPGLDALVAMAARREQGVSLGVVTGQPKITKAEAVGKIRGRFEMVTLVQLGERFGRPAIGLAGVLGVSADTSDDFVQVWKARIG